MNWDNEQYQELQAQGKCGWRLNSGGRCTNAISERLAMDPDNSVGPTLGACGMHFREFAQDLKLVQKRRWERSLKAFMKFQDRRLARALNKVGLMVQYDSYRQTFIIVNPNEFTNNLYKLGVVEELDLYGPCQEGPHVEPCGPDPNGDESVCACGCQYVDDRFDKEWKVCWPVPSSSEEPQPELEVTGGSFS